MIGIYKITNLKTNQSYIGQSVNIQRRINEHRGNHKGRIGTIDYYIQNLGANNFSFEVLEIRADYINMTLKEVCKKYNMYSERCIRGVVNGENYKYLPLYKKQERRWLNGGTY